MIECSDGIGGSPRVDEMLAVRLQISRSLAAAVDAIHRHFEDMEMAAFIRNAANTEARMLAAISIAV